MEEYLEERNSTQEEVMIKIKFKWDVLGLENEAYHNSAKGG